MHRILKVLVLTTMLALTGCATRYAPPNDISTSKITLSVSMDAPSAGYVFVKALGDDACSPHKYGTRMAIFTTLAQGDPHEGVDHRIEVGRDMVINFSYGSGLPGKTEIVSCKIITAFTPEEGSRYRAHFRYLGRTCELSLAKVDENLRPLTEPVKGIRRLKNACLNFNG